MFVCKEKDEFLQMFEHDKCKFYLVFWTDSEVFDIFDVIIDESAVVQLVDKDVIVLNFCFGVDRQLLAFFKTNIIGRFITLQLIFYSCF